MPIKFKSYQEDVVLEKWAAVGKHWWEEESGPSLDHGVTQGLWSVLKEQYSSSKYLPAQMSEKLVQRQFCVELNFWQCQPQTSNILASPRLLCICITYLFILLHTLHTFWLISVVLWIYQSYTITLSSSLPTRCSVQAVPLSCLLSICSVISSWTKEPRGWPHKTCRLPSDRLNTFKSVSQLYFSMFLSESPEFSSANISSGLKC